MPEETIEFLLRMDKPIYDRLTDKAKEKGLEISEFISFLVKSAYPKDPPSDADIQENPNHS